ncbi:hypothetical protein [Treponema zioleckii]|uniref:hypothetical protein n=1 Tax=Treponema zioleckii TaxID=331680 RepID=UPI00168A6161|nr:hypothetical protein [Treponema zioleckii]
MKITDLTNEKYNEKLFLVILLGAVETLINGLIDVGECKCILPLETLESKHFNSRLLHVIYDLQNLEKQKSIESVDFMQNLKELKERILSLMAEYDDYSNEKWLRVKNDVQAFELIDSCQHTNYGFVHYATVSDLYNLAKRLKSIQSIPKYILITPHFAFQEKLIPFDEYVFNIVAHTRVTESDRRKYYEAFENSSSSEMNYAIDCVRKRRFIIERGDFASYINCLEMIPEYLKNLIDRILPILKSEHNFQEKDLLYGNVCFEIFCE